MFAFQGWSEESTSASAEAFPAPRCQPMLLDVITLVTKSLAQSLNHCSALQQQYVPFIQGKKLLVLKFSVSDTGQDNSGII